ncbi:MAG TPA: O-methyltransferase [Acidimicrobiia bacterium]|nr:O-methyltransferase [Acidimicrobiia bacterium]
MTMAPERWEFLNAYSDEVFGAEDEHLAGLMAKAVAAGMPDISVGADVGRLLKILTSMTRGLVAVEVGTLAGYSGIWITRGLKPEGRLITIKAEPKHAAFARKQFERAGIADRVEIRPGAGIEVLTNLADELEPGSVDVLFLDAVKHEYSDYFRIARPLIAVGGLVLADNVYGTGSGWIDQGNGTDPFNRLIAADPDFEAVAVPLRQGVLIARRLR